MGSDALPVAPTFPHPIPDFVLRQIEKARLEDEAAAREAAASAQSSRYAAPAPSEEDYRSKRDVPAYAYSAPRSVESDESYEIIPILKTTEVREMSLLMLTLPLVALNLMSLMKLSPF